MTLEQKQIAIAEFEGWINNGFDRWNHSQLQGASQAAVRVDGLPPYLTSRDAICGAVAKLDEKQRRKFANYLRDIHDGFDPHPHKESEVLYLCAEALTACILSTPSQLADALLLTLGYKI